MTPSFARRVLGPILTVVLMTIGYGQTGKPPRPPVQPSTIEGTIKLANNAQMINRAEVELYREEELVGMRIADAHGNFRFEKMYPGRYRIVVRLAGFRQGEESMELIGQGGVTRRVMVQLEPERNFPVIAQTPTVSVTQLAIPEKADKEYRKGKDSLRQRKYPDAIKYFTRAIQIHPAFPQAFNDLGLCYRATGDVGKAESMFLDCLDVDPANLYGRMNLADLYAATGRLSQALRLLEETILLHPKKGEPHMALGMLYFDSGNLAAAEASCRKAEGLPGTSADVHLLLAKIYHQQGRFDLIVPELEAYLMKDPQGAYAEQVRANLARIKSR
ncbi:MAG TPA: tetratricopeptide repeat protein [Kiritimatiellia bacterium]|nr:tetratricopeptide repeat protein [Kiritimatiellia bacterium]